MAIKKDVIQVHTQHASGRVGVIRRIGRDIHVNLKRTAEKVDLLINPATAIAVIAGNISDLKTRGVTGKAVIVHIKHGDDRRRSSPDFIIRGPTREVTRLKTRIDQCFLNKNYAYKINVKKTIELIKYLAENRIKPIFVSPP